MPDRPFGEVEAVHEAAPRRRTFWPGRSVCTPAVTTNSPVSSALRDHDGGLVVSQDLHVAQGHGLALRIDHPHGRASVGLGERARRHLDAGRRGQPDAADDSVSELHGRRRIGDADLDLKRPGRGIRLGRNLPHPAGRLHLRVVGEGDLDLRVLRRAIPDELLGDVEDGVAAALTRELHDHLPGADHFARLGADRGDRARRRRLTTPCSSAAPARSAPAPGRSRPGPGRLRSFCWASSKLARVVQPSFRSSCCRAKVRRAWVSTASHRREVGLRRAQRIVLNLGVEPGDDLACARALARHGPAARSSVRRGEKRG